MNIRYGRVNTTINLRGHRFPAGTLIKIWKADTVTSIQPLPHITRYHEVLWYALPDIHLKHIEALKKYEAFAIGIGFLD